MKSTKWTQVLVVILALGMISLAIFPSVSGAVIAQPRDTRLSDSEEPGSVIVFPKFVKGSVLIDGIAVPKTEIEVSVLCPAQNIPCAEQTKVKLRAHWVCPGSQDPTTKFVCRETDFVVFTTVNGTVTLNPSRIAVAGSTAVPSAPCARGYLIMWVTDFSDRPIKFDGLIGDAVVRHSATSAEAYNAVPIQADPLAPANSLITLVGGALAFTGGAGQYQALPGVVEATVKFDRLTGSKINSFLTMLTLDVLSNRPNFPTFVDLVFWNQAEAPISTNTDFICWTEVALTSSGDPVFFIDDNLDEVGMGTRKGSFLSGPAEKVAIFGVTDTAGPVTLLGIVETQEFTAAGGLDREYSYSMYNNSIPVPTRFHP